MDVIYSFFFLSDLVEAIRCSASSSDLLHIIDARPKVNAVANQAMGKGFENEKLYRQTRIKFMNIANIHVMRESIQKLSDVGFCKDVMIGETVAASGWLEHVRRILVCAITIAAAVHVEEAPCLVHCLSEDADMQILTNHGFKCLRDVEKHFHRDRSLKAESDLLFAAYDSDTDEIRYEKCQKLIVNGAQDASFVEFTNGNDFSVVVTQDHDMWLRYGDSPVFVKEKAGHVCPRRSVEFCTKAKRGLPEPRENHFLNMETKDSKAFLKAYGFVLANRTISSGDDVVVFASETHGRYLEKQLKRLQIDFRYDSTQRAYVIAKWGTQGVGEPDWLSKLDSVSSLCVLEGMRHASGAKDSDVVFVSSSDLRDRVCQLAIHAGRSVRCHTTGENHWSVSYDGKDNDELVLRGDKNVKKVASSGRTWCVSVSTGKILVRRVAKDRAFRPVVIGNCSDGWDRTSQLTSLAMICLDPFFRTLKGFEILIEKEWLSFGHHFASRTGHDPKRMSSSQTSDQERSPVFLQFVDCVYQLMKLAPCSFEFNDLLLTEMMDAVYSCHFGTFLCDSDREREELRLKETTESFWTYVNERQKQFKIYSNVFYDPSTDPPVILPDIPQLHLWPYFLRYRERSIKDRQRPIIAPKSVEDAYRSLLQQLEEERKKNRKP